MTFNDMKTSDIINNNDYPKIKELNALRNRITKVTSEIVEEINDDSISYYVRDMEFARLIPEEDYVKVMLELPYDRIVDLSHKCEVDYFKGRDGVDIVSFNVNNTIDIQYGVSIAKQSFTYRKRLKL